MHLYNNLKYNVNFWKCPASSFVFYICLFLCFFHTLSLGALFGETLEPQNTLHSFQHWWCQDEMQQFWSQVDIISNSTCIVYAFLVGILVSIDMGITCAYIYIWHSAQWLALNMGSNITNNNNALGHLCFVRLTPSQVLTPPERQHKNLWRGSELSFHPILTYKIPT